MTRDTVRRSETVGPRIGPDPRPGATRQREGRFCGARRVGRGAARGEPDPADGAEWPTSREAQNRPSRGRDPRIGPDPRRLAAGPREGRFCGARGTAPGESARRIGSGPIQSNVRSSDLGHMVQTSIRSNGCSYRGLYHVTQVTKATLCDLGHTSTDPGTNVTQVTGPACETMARPPLSALATHSRPTRDPLATQTPRHAAAALLATTAEVPPGAPPAIWATIMRRRRVRPTLPSSGTGAHGSLTLDSGHQLTPIM